MTAQHERLEPPPPGLASVQAVMAPPSSAMPERARWPVRIVLGLAIIAGGIVIAWLAWTESPGPLVKNTHAATLDHGGSDFLD